MNYIYDIVLNFQKNYYNFFEWNRIDNIKNIYKIPLYHLKDEDLIKLNNELVKSDKTIVIEVNKKRYNDATPGNNEKLNPFEAIKSVTGIGGDVFVRFDPTDTTSLSDGTPSDPESTLAHEVAGHAYPMSIGTNPISRKKREQEATAIENKYRMFKGISQRKSYGDWPVPQFYPQRDEGDYSNEKKNK